jgi:hypothetical protein
MQTTLTQLVKKHLIDNFDDLKEFARVLLECEQVHLVTFKENYDALGQNLISWTDFNPCARCSLMQKSRNSQRVSGPKSGASEKFIAEARQRKCDGASRCQFKTKTSA